jgi:hypothetical protein
LFDNEGIMAITDYTTPEEVRSALSVNSTELPDEEVLLPLVEQRLEMRLYGISPNIEVRYSEIKLILEADRSAAQKKFMAAAQLLFTYAVAIDFCPTLGTMMTRVLSDGKASQERFNEAIEDTIAGISSMYELARNRALAWLQVVDTGNPIPTTTPTALTIMVAVPLAVDPVTG